MEIISHSACVEVGERLSHEQEGQRAPVHRGILLRMIISVYAGPLETGFVVGTLI